MKNSETGKIFKGRDGKRRRPNKVNGIKQVTWVKNAQDIFNQITDVTFSTRVFIM